jgi:DNA-binding NarL/FixJ family response regulator
MDDGSLVRNLHPTSGEVDAARRRTRVVLADDHQQFQDEIRRLLAVEFDVVCSVCDGPALLNAALKWRPDVIISDIKMPHLSGIAAARQILQEGLSKGAVMLTSYNEPELVRSAMEAHVLAYVLKVDAGEELIPAVEKVLNGQSYLSRSVR